MIHELRDQVFIHDLMYSTDLLKGTIQYLGQDRPNDKGIRDYALVRISKDEFFSDVKCYENEIYEKSIENTARYNKQQQYQQLTKQIEKLTKERDNL